MRVFQALRERIEDIPLEVLGEITKATSRSDWPLRHLFSEVEHEKARYAFSSGLGSSIRSQLASKGRSDAELDIGLLRTPDYEPDAAPAQGYDGKYPVDPAEIKAILQPGGPMSQEFEQYEYRPQQVEMAQAVADALNKGHHLVVEAGTGTGKSVGYLLPSILYAVRTGETVVRLYQHHQSPGPAFHEGPSAPSSRPGRGTNEEFKVQSPESKVRCAEHAVQDRAAEGEKQLPVPSPLVSLQKGRAVVS